MLPLCVCVCVCDGVRARARARTHAIAHGSVCEREDPVIFL